MSSLRQIATHRRLVLTVLLMVALSAVFAATPSSATTHGRCGTEFDYYSDSSHSDLVGVRGWLPMECGCAIYSWGTLTSYFDVTDAVC